VSERWSDFASSIHHQFAWPVGLLVGLHLLAILAYRLFKGQRLTRAMITGRKPADVIPESAAIPRSRSLLALVLVAIVAALTWWLLVAAPPEPAAGTDYW
jgi:hypothetical protein